MPWLLPVVFAWGIFIVCGYQNEGERFRKDYGIVWDALSVEKEGSVDVDTSKEGASMVQRGTKHVGKAYILILLVEKVAWF